MQVYSVSRKWIRVSIRAGAPRSYRKKKSRYNIRLKRDSHEQSDKPDLHGADEQGTLAATDAMQSCTLPCAQHLSPTFRDGLRPSVSVPDEKAYG